ncbi:MAG TPA: hypothetical protein VMF11_11380 [Candidatus Baltobacteraceae bacterium]|nr:hypothetical protein [Candidatus Baltobacteraceae bacterium]
MKAARRCISSAVVLIVLGCSHASGGPQGWTKANGTTWVNGSGAEQERYTMTSAAFNGSLKDLASQQTIDIVLKNAGTRFVQSVPFPNCPGQAGLATFRSPKAIVEDGFALEGERAVTILYVRPSGAAESPEVLAAMNAALCVPPA